MNLHADIIQLQAQIQEATSTRAIGMALFNESLTELILLQFVEDVYAERDRLVALPALTDESIKSSKDRPPLVPLTPSESDLNLSFCMRLALEIV